MTDAPQALHTLVGEKIGSIRAVSFGSGEGRPDEPAALEIEAKSGKVLHLMAGPGGGLQVGRGSAPDSAGTGVRRVTDLTERLPFAFNGRPEVAAVLPVHDANGLAGCRVELSTGGAFSYTLTPAGPRLEGAAPATPAVRVVPAAAADYAEILTLNEAAVPHVNSIDHATLEALANQACAFTVAKRRAAVVGFLLALPDGAPYDSPNYRYFARHYPSFAYVDRVVVAAAARGAGVGRLLYEALLNAVGKPVLTCEVNVRPPNPGSLAFHRKLGFEVVAEQDTEGGAKRVALMMRSMTGRSG